jgi:hypothetical protein
LESQIFFLPPPCDKQFFLLLLMILWSFMRCLVCQEG